VAKTLLGGLSGHSKLVSEKLSKARLELAGAAELFEFLAAILRAAVIALHQCLGIELKTPSCRVEEILI
jgi:hypothetical protein